MNPIYNIDWNVFVRKVWPGFVKKPMVLAYLDSVVAEIKKLHDQFREHTVEWRYQVAHTAQTVHIEKVLNDKFDDVERRIYIENVTFDEYIYLWPPEDENPHYLQEAGANPDKPVYLLEGDAGTINPDATIYVPEALKPATDTAVQEFEAGLRGLVDFYKTYGPNYQILYYE